MFLQENTHTYADADARLRKTTLKLRTKEQFHLQNSSHWRGSLTKAY